MGSLDRLGSSSEGNPRQAPREPQITAVPVPQQRFAADALYVKQRAPLAEPARRAAIAEEDDASLEAVVEQVDKPHGVMHAVEAGEALAGAVARAAGEGGRAAAELVGGHHHGLLGKAERWVERGVRWSARGSARALRQVRGGEGFVAGVQRLLGWPGRMLGPRLDALLGSQTLRFTGSGGRVVETMGGRLPLIGALLGGAIAIVDVRFAVKAVRSPRVSPWRKAVAATQGLCSATSGLLGLAALGGAFAVAVGLTAPFSIPALLGAAAVSGAGAFVLSFFLPRLEAGEKKPRPEEARKLG